MEIWKLTAGSRIEILGKGWAGVLSAKPMVQLETRGDLRTESRQSNRQSWFAQAALSQCHYQLLG